LQPLGERGAYLDAACGGDAELRACIEKMLAAQLDLGELLDRPRPIPKAIGEPGTVGERASTAAVLDNFSAG
jgi:hypothetical protein